MCGIRLTTEKQDQAYLPIRIEEVKYFDIIDVYYRLIMTGFMLVVSKDNDIRSICCIYIAVAYLAFIASKNLMSMRVSIWF